MKAGADVHQSGLTLSAYLLALTQRERGHGCVHLSYRYICRSKPQPRPNAFGPPYVKVSGGVLAQEPGPWTMVPEQAQRRLGALLGSKGALSLVWVKLQPCERNALGTGIATSVAVLQTM